MSEAMSPYCSAHDEWMIMKLCMYVGYHDANNVSNFGGDSVTQLNLKKTFYSIFYDVLRTLRSIAVFQVTVSAAVAMRSRADCSSMEDRRRKSLINVHHRHHERAYKRPYQPKHSPSYVIFLRIIPRNWLPRDPRCCNSALF